MEIESSAKLNPPADQSGFTPPAGNGLNMKSDRLANENAAEAKSPVARTTSSFAESLIPLPLKSMLVALAQDALANELSAGLNAPPKPMLPVICSAAAVTGFPIPTRRAANAVPDHTQNGLPKLNRTLRRKSGVRRGGRF